MILIGALLVVVAPFVLWRSLVPRVPGREVVAPRITERADRRREAQKVDLLTLIGRPIAGWLPESYDTGLERRLRRAATPASWTVARLVGAKVSAAVLLLAIGLPRMLANPGAFNVLLMLGGAAIGFFAPDALLNSRGDNRVDAIRSVLADAIDQLAVTVRAGLGINAALERLGRSIRGPLGDELSRVTQDIRLGMSRRDALESLADRIDIPELTHFVRALSRAGDLGLPIAETLQVQAGEMRVRRRQYAEEKAMKLPIKIMFPTILCILPALLIVVIGPAVASALRNLSGV